MKNHPLEQLITEYLTEKDITKGSYGLYDTNLKQYLSSLVEQDITYAATQDVIEYIDTKKSKTYSDKRIYHQISSIKRLYRDQTQNDENVLIYRFLMI